MKKRVIFLIAACLCALCCASAAAESVTLTAVVPDEHSVTVTIGEHGSIQCGEQQYSGTASIAVQRFGSVDIAIVPQAGYRLSAITASSGDYLEYDGESVTVSGIAEDLFIELSFESTHVLTLPAALTAIEDEAFRGDDSIEAVIIPDGCQSIGSRAFADCANLRYVRVPASVAFIADDAFEGCGQVVIDRTTE